MSQFDRHWDIERAKLAVGLVAYALKLPADEMLASKRGMAEVAYARQLAMYAVYVSFGISLARVAAAFGRDRSTVAYACHLVEDRRDDAELDTWLDALEAALRQAAALSGTTRTTA